MGHFDYEALATDYKNSIKFLGKDAIVFLENQNDEEFWNAQIQKCKAGNYDFISNTRDIKHGLGCHSCDKFKGFLSKDFFVCFDSDWKLLLEKPDHPTKQDFYAQTYAYSWENHCCYAGTLQNRFGSAFPVEANKFDFSLFLSNLSHKIYRYFLEALSKSTQKNNAPLFTFYKSIPKQATKEEIQNNGELLICNIEDKLKTTFGDPSVNMAIKNKYKNMGMEEDNCYLYFRGHEIYDLIVNIGNHLTRDKSKFILDVLQNPLLVQGYKEADKMHDDLDYILK